MKFPTPLSWENGHDEFPDGHSLRNLSWNVLRNPVWRDGAMTTTPSPFQLLSTHIGQRARTPEARQLAARISGSPADGPDPDLADLLSRRDADGHPAIRVIEALAAEAAADPLAALALLHVLRPELEVMSKRLLHSGRVSVLDAEADTLSAAWEVVTKRPSLARWDRSDAIWNEARRASRMRRLRSPEADQLPQDFDREEPRDSSDHRRPELLAGAVAAGVVTPRDVVLIVRTRVEGHPLAEVAKALGRPYDAVRMERHRAEAALRTFARRYESEGSS